MNKLYRVLILLLVFFGLGIQCASAANTISFNPQTFETSMGSSKNVQIVIDEVPSGLSGFKITISVLDPKIAEITNVSFPSWNTVPDNSTVPSSSVWIQGVDGDKKVNKSDTNVLLGTITITGKKAGTTNLSINTNNPNRVSSDNVNNNKIHPVLIQGQINILENESPVINSVNLNNSTPNTGNPILVTVNTTDNVGVNEVKANNISLAKNGNLWSGIITAIEGVHSVNVSAKDIAGNTAWNNSTFYTAVTTDTTAPVIASVSLNNSTPNTGNPILVTVNATDNVGVTSVEASGSQLTHLSGDIWEGTLTAIEGIHAVNVSSVDEAGNIAWNNSTSYTAVTPDTTSPVIASVSLNNSTPKTGDLIRMNVGATDNVAIISVEASGSQLTHLSGDIWEGTLTAIEGTHSVNVSAKDATGNIAWNNSTSYTAVTPDTTAPVIASVSLNNSTPNTGNPILVTVDVTDNIGVSEVKANDVSLVQSGDIWEGTLTALEGTHSINVSAKDVAGNTAWNNSTLYTAVTPDTTSPIIDSVSLNNSTPNTDDSILVTVDTTDNIGVSEVKINDVSLVQSGNLWSGIITALEGTHSVNVSAKDVAGNIAWNNSTSYTAVTPDTTSPVISSVSLNNSTPNTGDIIRMNVGATDNVAVTSVEASGSPLTHLSGDIWEGTLTALEGVHSVNVSAKDVAGNIAWNNSTFYTAVTPDTTSPIIASVNLNNSTPNTDDLILVTVDTIDNIGVSEVKANDVSLVQSGNIWSGIITALEGTHNVNVSSVDEAGNIAWSNSTFYTAVTPDTTSPIIDSVSLNNSTPNTDDSILVTVDTADNIAVSSVKANDVSLVKSENLWRGIITAIEGVHSVNVSSMDEAGNIAWNNSTSYTAVTPDTTSPIIASVSLNNSTPNTDDLIRINVGAIDNVEVTSVEALGSPLTHLSGDIWEGTLTALEGTHSVNVSAKDAAGNIAWNNSTSYTAVTQDTVSPVIASVSLNNSTPNTGNPILVTVDVTDNIGVSEVKINDVSLVQSGNLWSGIITALEGTRSVNVSAKDIAGNTAWNNSTSYTAVTPDTTSPVISSVSLNNSTPNTGDIIRMNVGATDNVAIISVEASGSPLTHLSGDIWEGTLTALEGVHSVNVSAKDAAGNIAWNNSTSYTAVTPDTTSPVINSVELNDSTPKTDDSILVTVDTTDNIGVNEVKANDVPLVQSGNIWSGIITALEGTHNVNVSSVDEAGNIAWNNSTSYTAVTPIPPQSISEIHSSSGPTWINWTWTNPDDSNFDYTEIYLNGTFQAKTSAEYFNATELQPETDYTLGTHTVDVYGNVNEIWVNASTKTEPLPDVEQTVTDNDQPEIQSVLLFPANTTAGSKIYINANIRDNTGVAKVMAGDAQLMSIGGSWLGNITAPSSPGKYSLSIKANDATGNTVDTSVPYNVVRRKGGVKVEVMPTFSKVGGGKSTTLTVKVRNTQNIDDTFKVRVNVNGIPAFYRAGDSWFNWTEKTVNLRAKQEVLIPIEVKVPAGNSSGLKLFRVKVNSEMFSVQWSDIGYLVISHPRYV